MFFNSIKRALLTVSDKTGIIEFAKKLHAFHIEIISTGGTAKLLREYHIPVIEVADYTEFPELMDGRLKTLHPKIHGGILGRRGIDDEILEKYHIPAIDLVVVNLYPFEKTVTDPHCNLHTAIENIDIGGPTLLRAAAKNYAAVTVVVDPNDYANIIAELEKHQGQTSPETRFELAKKVFAHTAAYDSAITDYLNKYKNSHAKIFPDYYHINLVKKQDLRYGENPHQTAAVYIEKNILTASVVNAKQLQGKALSYNNIADGDCALECVKSFIPNIACVIVKHATPCGVAMDNNQHDAYQKAFAADPVSAFGGIIAFNTPLTAKTAEIILENQFVEVIIAPKIEIEALPVLEKKSQIRVLQAGTNMLPMQNYDYKRVHGGLLIQEPDIFELQTEHLKVVTQRIPTPQEQENLLFAWKVAKFTKSNAIVLANQLATIGIGAGQTSRVDSVEIAVKKAKHFGFSIKGAVMASDAFFPFKDGIELAIQAGITAVIQPGGSIRDKEIISAADAAGIAMIFTGIRHFRH
jgi:phosphoribosylaminoimidazolecarboxamide formyltransferase/IMP cyclohydrolase